VAAISVGSVEVDVVPNARGIRAQLQASLVPAADQVGDEIGRIIGRHISTQVAQAVRSGVTTGARTATPAAVRGGQQTGSAFARSLRTTLQAALRDLPEVRLNANSSDAQREIYNIRRQLQMLSDARIGIDISSADAVAAINHLQQRLQRLSASDADVAIRVDAGAAASQLAALQAQVNRLDGDDVNINVNTRSAAANLSLLTSAALTLGPAILPVLPVVAAGLGAIAAAATAAAVGVGSIALVAVPAVMQMGKVMQAQKAAQDAATQATMQGGQASAQAAQRSLQMAGAQQSLAAAHRNAARQITQAQQGVQDAVRGAAEANARAADQVKQAQRGLADVVQQAADRQREAAEQVRAAEDSLADAQRDARRAQEDLNGARLDAAKQLEDLQSRLANAQLSERDAVLAVEEARQRLQEVQAAGSKATLLDQQRAQLAYDQAVQRLKDQRSETADLTAEQKAAQRAGVEGSETVRNAQERLRDAEERVTDQQRSLAKAREDAARQQVQAQRDIADAQDRVAEAQRNLARTQKDGARSVARAQEQLASAQESAAESIASAQRQIASASLSAAGGVDQAALAQQKYQAELAKLTPAARETFDAFLGLKDAFGAWSKSLQPAVMPIFTRAIQALTRALPGLTPFVLEAASAIQTLMDKASTELKTPFWKGFKDDLQKSVKPAIIGLGTAFGNIFKGMAGVIGAFLPHMDSISEKMGDVTGKFADWGASLKGSPDFQRFLQYSSDMAPKLWEALRQIAGAAISIASAMSPITSVVLESVAAVADGIGWLADNAPWVIQGIYGIVLAMTAWRLAMLAWRGATLLASAAMTAFNIVSMAGPWGWIVLAVLGVVAVIYLLWTKCEWFRDAVKAVWDAIKAGAIAVKDWFTGPFARFWTETIPSWARMLKDKVLGWWNALKNGLKAGWDWIKTWVFYPVRDFFTQTIPSWGRTLRERTVAAWNGLRDGFAEGWGQIKTWVLYPVRDFFLKTIPGWGTTMKDKLVDAWELARDGIADAWDGIKKATKDPINWVIRTVWNNGVVDIWGKIRDWVPGLPKLDELPLLAQGGTVPARPGVFNRPTAIVGEGNPRHPEFVIPTDPRYRGRALDLWQAAGGQLMADGGILGDIVGGIKSIGGKVGGAFKSAGSFLADPGKALDGLLGNLLKPMQKFKDTGFGALALALPKAMFKGLKSLVGMGDGGGGSIGGTIPKGNRLAIINQALAAAGVPPPGTLAQWQAGLNTLITRESGWNPNARNNWDINAKNGVPSQGLAQTIPPTFNAYVPPSLRSRGILDPVANVAAAVRYIVARYGNITNVQQANANRPPAGYDSGGYLQPGLNLAYNGTGRPEPVFTTAQANALTSLAARGVAGGPASFEGDLYLDSGEFLGRVRGEAQRVVDQSQRDLMSVINAS
jgi:VIT1/CCC1 family predicted Fe2+/Mn2+ transporter